MPLLTIEADTLRTLTGAAQSYSDDLSTGLDDGTYEEGSEELDELETALAQADALLAPEPPDALALVRGLSQTDRNLVASALHDSGHLVDDDMGDDPKQRHAAYQALAQLVREAQ